MMNFNFQNNNYQISRYPQTDDHSLSAWNAADELLLDYVKEYVQKESNISIYHDKFGVLSTCLHLFQPTVIILLKSQEKAILQNLTQNNINQISFKTPLDSFIGNIDYSLIKIPKSIDLFELYLSQISRSLHANSVVIGGFMTKYFSKRSITIAQKYFDDVSQSKAKKKARLLVMKSPKPPMATSLLHDIKLDDNKIYKQYFGVFSAKNIDYASQFLMANIHLKKEDKKILDLGCGNGILACKARELSPTAKINLLDDNFLAVESAKLNLGEANNFFHFDDSLDKFTSHSFDYVISNPPFHFEHENNIDISLNLFKQVHRILKNGGRFQLVSNKHLNYQTHLKNIFEKVEDVISNEKFIVYTCEKKY